MSPVYDYKMAAGDLTFGMQISSHEVSSAYGMVCRATEVLVPTSTEQLAAAIKSYAKLATKQPVHVRATHK